jgi:uncharacterized protein YbaA (DUF1428 family)
MTCIEGFAAAVPAANKGVCRKRAVQAEPEEAVVFSWIEWLDKAARDAGMKKAMDDPRMHQDMGKMPTDGKRMTFGGIVPILDA